MKEKKCLVVMDGLDEWTDPKGKLTLPVIASSHALCSWLVTSRPWKLADERIKDSQMDILLELTGIADTNKLTRLILGRFASEDQVEGMQKEIYLETHNLKALLYSPMMHTRIICAFVERTSLCSMYSLTVDILMKKGC
ncbi:hypothetical protein DPMN_166408 [Dreissena polymorpha]|uniref:NACHT domain-containing protein n=1 Tax=Dreissena polymorpha TaxID=45954 RepID=A0A9D4EYK3_DREPO|nr:hypothetical protein DPMN_166408 [Dreissena polymorpha]